MLEKDQILNIAKDYFAAFEAKDLEKLDELFDENIILYDPIIKEIKTKEQVLKANKMIFDNSQNIKMLFKRIFVDQYSNACIGELKIHFDGKLIEVVDIIELNENGKITKITAYLDSAQA